MCMMQNFNCCLPLYNYNIDKRITHINTAFQKPAFTISEKASTMLLIKDIDLNLNDIDLLNQILALTQKDAFSRELLNSASKFAFFHNDYFIITRYRVIIAALQDNAHEIFTHMPQEICHKISAINKQREHWWNIFIQQFCLSNDKKPSKIEHLNFSTLTSQNVNDDNMRATKEYILGILSHEMRHLNLSIQAQLNYSIFNSDGRITTEINHAIASLITATSKLRHLIIKKAETFRAEKNRKNNYSFIISPTHPNGENDYRNSQIIQFKKHTPSPSMQKMTAPKRKILQCNLAQNIPLVGLFRSIQYAHKLPPHHHFIKINTKYIESLDNLPVNIPIGAVVIFCNITTNTGFLYYGNDEFKAMSINDVHSNEFLFFDDHRPYHIIPTQKPNQVLSGACKEVNGLNSRTVSITYHKDKSNNKSFFTLATRHKLLSKNRYITEKMVQIEQNKFLDYNGGMSLDKYLDAGRETPPRLYAPLMKELKDLHACGIYLGDIKLENMLIKTKANGESKIIIIDLDSLYSITKLTQHASISRTPLYTTHSAWEKFTTGIKTINDDNDDVADFKKLAKAMDEFALAVSIMIACGTLQHIIRYFQANISLHSVPWIDGISISMLLNGLNTRVQTDKIRQFIRGNIKPEHQNRFYQLITNVINYAKDPNNNNISLYDMFNWV